MIKSDDVPQRFVQLAEGYLCLDHEGYNDLRGALAAVLNELFPGEKVDAPDVRFRPDVHCRVRLDDVLDIALKRARVPSQPRPEAHKGMATGTRAEGLE